jgi:DNA-binding transcriptional LysR family regulator
MVNLNRFDLNLLVALDMLLTERSVTRAADRLCVTQPALSGSLQRLREHFHDQLLFRVGREMELTPKARALIAPVRAALLKVESALEARATFEPANSERTFHISMSDYCALVFLPLVVRRIAVEAPRIRLVVENVFGPSFNRLVEGDIDLIITHGDRRLFGRNGTDAELLSENLFMDSFVCAVAADHPISEKMTLADYVRYPHALAHFGAKLRTVEDADIERQGIAIKDMLLIPTFAGLLCQLPGTELIATLQRRLVVMMAKIVDVRIFEPPMPLSPLQETIIWHERNTDDPGHEWLRVLMRDIGRSMD